MVLLVSFSKTKRGKESEKTGLATYLHIQTSILLKRVSLGHDRKNGRNDRKGGRNDRKGGRNDRKNGRNDNKLNGRCPYIY